MEYFDYSGMDYADFREQSHEDNDNCCICNADLGMLCPWSLCFDPMVHNNCWGGDSHAYRAFICQECAVKMLSKDKHELIREPK